MKVRGIIIHHSVCPAINGKGFDFFIMRNGMIVPASSPTDPEHVHICLEGDFHDSLLLLHKETTEQLFLAQKLIIRLSQTLGFDPSAVFPHNNKCPGPEFPWQRLVISQKDGYH